MGGVDEHIVGSARDLHVAFGLQFRGGLVVDDLVGAEDVAAVVAHHFAGEGPDIAHAGLALRLPLHGHASRGRGLGLGDGQNFLARIVRKLRGGIDLKPAGRVWKAGAGRAGRGGSLRGRR